MDNGRCHRHGGRTHAPQRMGGTAPPSSGIKTAESPSQPIDRWYFAGDYESSQSVASAAGGGVGAARADRSTAPRDVAALGGDARRRCVARLHALVVALGES